MPLGLMRAAALAATMAGGVVSLGLTLREGAESPGGLMVVMALWVTAPFVALGWANLISARWPVALRVTIHTVTFAVTAMSLAYYGHLIPAPAGSARAFIYVMVPGASWLLLLTAFVISLTLLRRR